MTTLLDVHLSESFARLALANLGHEYPAKLDHVLSGDESLAPPRALFPVFHGSFDWHSCVWALDAGPAAWEPCGSDFLSPSLIDADLIRGVLAPDAFGDWLQGFLPGMASEQPATSFAPAFVSDRSDGYTAFAVLSMTATAQSDVNLTAFQTP